MHFPHPIHRLLTLAAVSLAACHESTGPQGGVLLRFSGAASVTDTIDAIIPQALVVEVHDSTGAPAPAGTVVRFTSVLEPTYRIPEVLVEPLTATYYSTFATGTTDQAGKTGVLVRLGPIAGPGRLAVNVPTLGLEDTVRFTVKPGNTMQVLVTPADTALYVGKSYTLRGGAFDRYGNPRTDPVTWSTTGSGITVSSAGVVTGTAVGRYQLRAVGVVAGVAGTATGWVSVVPTGRFAAMAPTGNYQGLDVVTLDVDGSNRTRLVTVTDGGIGIHPAWIPGTSTVVYTAANAGFQRLFMVRADGVSTPFFPIPPPNVTQEAEPTPSADGNWLFLSVYDSACSQYDYCIARSKIDGSAYQLLQRIPSRQPAPSPDGTKVAFLVPTQQAIRVYDIAANATSAWSVVGSTPAWSPDGTRIAYRNTGGGVSIVNPDGTGQMALTNTYTSRVFSWSPDSKWVIAQQSGGPALIDAATGVSLPLGYTTGTVPWSMK